MKRKRSAPKYTPVPRAPILRSSPAKDSVRHRCMTAGGALIILTLIGLFLAYPMKLGTLSMLAPLLVAGLLVCVAKR